MYMEQAYFVVTVSGDNLRGCFTPKFRGSVSILHCHQIWGSPWNVSGFLLSVNGALLNYSSAPHLTSTNHQVRTVRPVCDGQPDVVFLGCSD